MKAVRWQGDCWAERFVRFLVVVVVVVVSASCTVVPDAPYTPIRTSDPTTATVDPCEPAGRSVVACENTRPGARNTEWDVHSTGSGDPSLQGFATDASVNVGGVVQFKVNTAAPAYRLDIYRLGFYGGMGARKVTTIAPSTPLPQNQPACLTDGATLLVDCGNWAVSASWAVPGDVVSGIYFAHLVRPDTGGDSHIVFVVRNDSSHADLLLQTPDESWTAYNSYGGNSLYTGAVKASYNRPNDVRGGKYSRTWLFDDVYPMVRWLEANGYDASYTTGVDSDRSGSVIKQHKTFLSVGHDEYWSGPQRTNVEAARDAGTNLAFFSGNTMFWKTRWENSIDGSATGNRTLVTHKESTKNGPTDPQAPPTWTGTWRDARFSPPADGGRPENALTGTSFMVNCCQFKPVTVSAEESKLRFWRNTRLSGMTAGTSTNVGAGIVGYELDSDVDNGSRPAGQIDMSTTTIENAAVLVDYADTYRTGSATHSLTYHRAPSGALIFGAGTVHWSWGLDSTHAPDDIAPPAPDRDIQQATVNVLADMGSQPATPQPGLVPGSPSTDTTAPTSAINWPTAATQITVGTPVTVTGTATDSGAGVIGGIEVSTDGGKTWHPATGRGTWSYTFTPRSSAPLTIKSRATDDSLNTEPPGPGVAVTPAPRACPCSIWTPAAVPTASFNEGSPVELGLKFRSDKAGNITGVRFYKNTDNTGSHLGHLWSTNGKLLASTTFTAETGSGWQEAAFSTPVPIAANTTYLVSYYSPTGSFSADTSFFARHAEDFDFLHALASGADGPNGVYIDNADTFPTSTFSDANYWVDVVFN